MDNDRKFFKSEQDGALLAYRETGPADAPTVILMHGWGCTADTLRVIEQSLSKEFHVYNVDFPGFGASPEPPEVWGVADYAALIGRFIDACKIERPMLLGHSFGGRVGITLASVRHDISKMILVDAAGIKPKRPLKYYWNVYSYKTWKWLMRALMGREKADAVIAARKVGSADYRNLSPRMRAVMSRVVNEDLRHLMPEIAAPTLLMWGENDTATPLSDARTMNGLIKGSGLVTFAGCGHYSFLDNTPRFLAVLQSFVHSS